MVSSPAPLPIHPMGAPAKYQELLSREEAGAVGTCSPPPRLEETHLPLSSEVISSEVSRGSLIQPHPKSKSSLSVSDFEAQPL